MKIVKPKKIKKGDLIGIISPASSPDDLQKIEPGVKYLERLGYNVEVGKNVGSYRGYLAGEDNQRLDDLHYMFKKKDIKAILCVRGGYGSPRLLNKIDYKIIRNNPKIFVGYSDITALQLAFFKKAGLITFAGPMLAVDFHNEVSSYTEENFWKILTSNKKIGKVSLPKDENIYPVVKGSAAGRIIGGNLALIISLMGTEFIPDMKNMILFMEEVGEAPYRIDRMFSHLNLAKVFDKINGAVLGSFVDCNETDPSKKTLTLGEIVNDYFGKLKKPVIYNFPHGHVKNIFTIPFGAKVKLNASRSFVEIMESAVT